MKWYHASTILITKQFLKQLLRPFLPFLRQHDGFGFADRIANQPFGVESVQRVPIMPFPGAGIGEFAAALSETCQVQQGEHCVIYFVEVGFHKGKLPGGDPGLRGSRGWEASIPCSTAATSAQCGAWWSRS